MGFWNETPSTAFWIVGRYPFNAQIQTRMVYNEGYDDEAGDYIIREGDMIHERYKISVRPGSKTPLLGKGSFGQVAYAYDMTENLGVAIKVPMIAHVLFRMHQLVCLVFGIVRTQIRPMSSFFSLQ